jgi:magnesium-transporting ATPase (P-type)
MESGRVTLEGGWRLERIRRMKLYLYVVQIVSVFAIAIFLIMVGKGFSLKPFYLPINSFIYFVLLMGLVIGAESFAFTVLEIRFTQSASSKYYMAKKFTRRALAIIVISVIIIIILWVPVISKTIEDTLSTSGDIDGVKDFSNKDPMGLTAVDGITITSVGGTANIYVVSESNYNLYKSNITLLSAHRVNGNDYSVSESLPTMTFAFPDADYGTFHMVVDDLGGTPTPISYTLHKNISHTFMDYVPLFALLFIIVYAVAIVYLQVMIRKYAVGAIYR